METETQNPIEAIYDYLKTHTEPSEEFNMMFFGVKPANEANPKDLRALVEAIPRRSHGVEVDIFDGEEHGYIKLGAWLDDQGFALHLMGLGAEIGLWKLLTPKTVMGKTITDEFAMKMAGQGMISIQAPRDTAIELERRPRAKEAIRRQVRIRKESSRIRRFESMAGIVRDKRTRLFDSNYGPGYRLEDWTREFAIFVFRDFKPMEIK